jgi:hypothetical protein
MESSRVITDVSWTVSVSVIRMWCDVSYICWEGFLIQEKILHAHIPIIAFLIISL